MVELGSKCLNSTPESSKLSQGPGGSVLSSTDPVSSLRDLVPNPKYSVPILYSRDQDSSLRT